jgi:hypothetical protein
MTTPANTPTMSIVQAFQQAEAVLRANPEFAVALDKAKAENLSPEAAACLLLSRLDKDTTAALMQLASVHDAVSVNQPTPPLVVRHPSGRTALNPVVEAALAERASLDGDAPEFRFGPLPEGGTPAVPVKTTSRNPVQVGLMLERASQEVAREYQVALTQHAERAALLLDQAEKEGQNLALVRQSVEALVPTGVKGYMAGVPPALREVAPPTTGELARLSPSDERRMVWKAVSTTQGRRSLAPVFEQALAEKFPSIEFGGSPKKGATEVSWTVQAFGADDLDPKFALVENGVGVFASALTTLEGKPYRACVQPVNNLSSRTFGWTLYVWDKEQP